MRESCLAGTLLGLRSYSEGGVKGDSRLRPAGAPW